MIHRIFTIPRHAPMLALVIVGCSVFGVETNDDLNVLGTRILAPFFDREVDAEPAQKLLKTLRPDGSWEGINYQDRTRANWELKQHLENLTTLVLAYKSPKSPIRNNPELKRGVFASLDCWLIHDFQNPNWWWNTIGVPRFLSPPMLMLEDELTAAQREQGLAILERGKLGMTGQNLVWVAEITIVRGIMERNPELVGSAFKRIADEIKTTGEEGIQPDFSFRQHGKCLYNHGYGAAFATDCPRLTALAQGTRFAFPKEKIDIIVRYILDGSQWLARGSVGDYGADGREICRQGQTAEYLLKAANSLLKLPTGRERELKALISRVQDPAAPPLEGNRHFWRSDIMTHHRAKYYASARMYSERMDNTDIVCNGEGGKSHHVADGCNYLFLSGDEYSDIFPVWDWHKVPGTTAEQTGTLEGDPRRTGTTDFVGGVSDGWHGLAAFDFERDGLQARKAWFFFDREYVCLGAGIICSSTNQVMTTVNQCLLRGDIVTFSDAGEKRLPTGRHRLESPATVCHDGVAYMFMSDANLLVKNASQEGSWSLVSTTSSKDKIALDVFTLCIDHGANPRNATYEYIVCPGMGGSEAKEYAKAPDVEVLGNTAKLQAVRHRKLGLSQIAFYKPGSLKITDAVVLAVDKPCLLMAHHVDNGFRLSVSDPTQKLMAINIKISGRLQGEGCTFDGVANATTVLVALPVGGRAGQSVGRMLRQVDQEGGIQE